MAGIANDVKQIRQALYGREVREAIAHGIEQCYSDVTASKTVADTAAAAANTATQNAQTATQQANQARDNAQAVADGVVNQSITAINDAAAQQRQSVNDLGDQLKDYLEDHYGETTDKVAAKANRSSVSTIKHAIGADGQLTLTDALNEPAKKMTIHLEPKQDLHGYDHPWVGGAGKNLCASSVKSETAFGLTIKLNEDGTFLVSGTYQRDTTTEYFENNSFTLPAGTYVLNGTPYNNLGYQLRVKSGATTLCSGNNTFTLSASTTVLVVLYVPYSSSGKALPASGFLFEPMIRLATITDPTYEPYSNICPIEGFDTVSAVSTGKNLIAGTFYNINVGSHALDAGGNQFSTCYAKVKKGETYVVVTADNNAVYGFIDKQQIESGSSFCNEYPDRFVEAVIVATDGRKYQRITAQITGWIVWRTTLGALDNCAIYRGTELLDDPYQSSKISLNLVSSAGSTVYGGTVTVNEDGSGTLVVDTCIEDMGEINWSYNDDGRFKGAMKKQIKGYGTVDARTVDFVCSCYDVISDSSPYNGALNGVIYYAATMLWAQDNRYTDSEQYRSAMSGQMVAYPLNNPVTYQLTATELKTLVGTNHILTDGTSIELDYYADKYGLVDRLLAAFPKDTATGNPATFTDGADDLPVEKLEVAIEPKQDLHGYDNPWVGGARKNLLPDSGYVSGVMDWNAQNADGVINNIHFITSPYIKISENEQYTISAFSGNIVRIYITDENYNTLYFLGNNPTAGSSRTLPKTAGARYIRISIGIDDQTVTPNDYGAIVYGQLETGSVASAYEPYSNTCPITGWDVSEIKITDESVLQFVGSTTSANGIIATKTYEGLLTVKGTATDTFDKYLDNYPIPAGHYIFSGIAPITSSGVTTWYVYNTNTGKRIISSTNPNGMTVDVPEGQYARFGLIVGTGDKVNVQCRPTLTKVVNTINLPIKSISGSTVYGGKLTVKGDGSGELVVDRAMLTELSFTSVVSGGVSAGGLHWIDKIDLAYTIGDGNSISSHLTKKEGNAGWASKIPCYDASDGKVIRIYCKSDNISDFRKEMAGLQICYKTTPVTYSLTTNEVFTLLGSNHISCDAGEVTVTYHADPTLFITKKIAQALNA